MTLFLLLSTFIWAEEDHHATTTWNFIDEGHRTISKKLFQWADELDETISGWMQQNQCQTSPQTLPLKTQNGQGSIDTFFQSDKYLNETDDTYIRFRIDSLLRSKNSHSVNLKVSAQLPFVKCRQSFRFFIEDTPFEDTRHMPENPEDDESNVGINYFPPKKHHIISKYSVGLSGLDPYVSARYDRLFQYGDWRIDPVQLFKYSVDDKFEEETNIYFDTNLDEASLFRLQLHRKTQTDVDGMDYALGLHYYWSPDASHGLDVGMFFEGNTEYSYTADIDTPQAHLESYSGINHYSLSIGWRASVWRDWFFYEITPQVHFRRKYDYDPDYALRFYLDFYFDQHR